MRPNRADASGLLLRRDQVMGDGEESQFKARGDAGLVEDIGEVTLYRLFTERELFRNITVAATLDDATHHLKFARGETVSLALRHGGLLHQVVERRDEIDDALAADPIVARMNGADGRLQMIRERVFENDSAGADMQSFDYLLRCYGGGQK